MINETSPADEVEVPQGEISILMSNLHESTGVLSNRLVRLFDVISSISIQEEKGDRLTPELSQPAPMTVIGEEISKANRKILAMIEAVENAIRKVEL